MSKSRQDQAYESLAALLANAEQVSWSRFSNFLLFNSFLILGWVTLYTANLPPQNQGLLLAAISVLGIAGGIFWAGLGLRGRENVSAILDMGSGIEGNDETHPFSKLMGLRKTNPFKWCGSRYILAIAPLVVSAFQVFLLYLSLSENRCWQLFLTLGASIFVVVFASYVLFTLKSPGQAKEDQHRAGKKETDQQANQG